MTSSILIGVTDRDQQQSLPEASGKTRDYCQVKNWVKFIFVILWSYCAASDRRQGNSKDELLSKRLRPCRTHQVESQRRSSWSKPHVFVCPVCGVIRVDFRHPYRGRIEQEQSLPEISGITVRQLYFLVESVGFILFYCVTSDSNFISPSFHLHIKVNPFRTAVSFRGHTT